MQRCRLPGHVACHGKARRAGPDQKHWRFQFQFRAADAPLSQLQNQADS